MRTRLLVLFFSAAVAWSSQEFPNCTLPGAVDASKETNAHDVNVLFLSTQSILIFDSYGACTASGRVWNDSKCWQAPDNMLFPVVAYLAARDFNARDGKYVPAFAALGKCDKRISITLADSRQVGAGVVETILDSLAWQQLAVRNGGDQPSPLGPTWEDLASLLAGGTSTALHGVVGPTRSSQSMEIAPLTGALDILQLSYQSTSPALDNKRDYPRFGRTITSDAAIGAVVVELWVELNLTYGAVLYVNDAYGNGYADAVLVAAEEHNLKDTTEEQLVVKTFPFAESDGEIQRAVDFLKKWEPTNNTGCAEGEGRYGCSVNNILFVGFNQQVEAFYEEAVKQGVLKETVPALVLLSDGVTLIDLEKLTGVARNAANGAARILAVGGQNSNPLWRNFTSDWTSTPASDRDAINELLPPEWQLAADFFNDDALLSSSVARDAAAYAYDAIAALGLLACEVAPSGPLPTDFGTLGWQNMTNVTDGLRFNGTTGIVEFNKFGSRDKSTANFEVQNEVLIDDVFVREPLARYGVATDRFDWYDGSEWYDVNGHSLVYSFGQPGPVKNPQPRGPTPDDRTPAWIWAAASILIIFVGVYLLRQRLAPLNPRAYLSAYISARLPVPRLTGLQPVPELRRMYSEILGELSRMSGRFNTEEETLTEILDSYDRFASTPRELVFGRPAQATLGVEAYMCVPDNIVHQGRIDGTAAIVNEVAHAGTEVDKECLFYVLYREAGSSDLTFQGGLKRDCDENGKVLESRTIWAGAMRRGMVLRDFVAHKHSRLANLEQAHVVALRLYTTAAFQSINNPLRDWGRYERGESHPLPATVALLRDALTKLRSVEAELSRVSASSQLLLYRGMKDVAAPKSFMADGGTELAPMSTTSDLSVALRYSANRTITSEHVLLRLITDSFYDRGPNVSFLSAFPSEAEYLFPPLTYLQPTGRTETVSVGGLSYQVVDVKPRI